MIDKATTPLNERIARHILFLGLFVVSIALTQTLKIWFGLSLGDQGFAALAYFKGFATGMIAAFWFWFPH